MKYCRKLKRDNKEKDSEKNNHVDKVKNHIATAITEGYFILLRDDLINVTCNKTTWIVKTGVTIHAMS